MTVNNAYITSNCGNLSFYFKGKKAYNHPFIGMLFVNDRDYVKLCQNFDYYVNQTPICSLPNPNSLWAQQNGQTWYNHVEIKPPYPVLYLDDIELHFIHEKDENVLLDKFKRRVERYNTERPNLIFMWSDVDFCNDFSKEDRVELVKSFTVLRNSFFLSKYENERSNNIHIVPEWIGTSNERDQSHILLTHNIVDRMEIFQHIINKIENI